MPEQTPAEERTRWFREAKFGMFIHWGLYAQAAGVWEGRKYFGIGEWLMHRAEIPTGEYEKLAAAFNPVRFDAEQWVALAQAAGMKYLVITAKHHDGFAMFGSEASSFNIVDATAFGRDPLRELAEACQAAGVKLCFYYSQWQDWHEPGGAGNHWEFPHSAARFGEYFETKCKPQIRELLSNYGPVGLIWFDTPGGMTTEQSAELVELVHTLQPECLVSSRVGNDVGDFLDLGDHELPSEAIAGPWESLFTHNDSWGFVQFDRNWRSTRELVRMLLRINARGGNLLLNVGPQSDGLIPAASVAVLQRVGAWIAANAEAIYGTTAADFPELAWGECTARPGALYLHVLTWPEDRWLRVPGLRGDVQAVSLLACGTALEWRREGDDVLLALPDRMPDPVATTLKLEYAGELEVDPRRALLPGLRNELLPAEAQLSGATVAHKHSWMEEYGDWKHLPVLEGWQGPDDAAAWTVRVVEPGQFRVSLSYSRSGPAGRVATLTAADQTLWIEAQNTGTEPRHLFTHTIGVLTFDRAGEHTLRLAPEDVGDELCKLEKLVLEPFA
jgi:alpha-L-fucosidase